MAGPLTWWANRKSRIGVSPSAIAPPHVHGQPWWTTPPIAPPQPEHIEYAVKFQLELMRVRQSHARDAMLAHVAAWMRAARRLLHERVESDRGDLLTTDGLLIAAGKSFACLVGRCLRAGVEVTPRDLEIQQALDARAREARRRRAGASR